MALQVHYRDLQDWETWPECVTKVDDIPAESLIVSFYREKKSHRGIGARVEVEKLVAKQVNQEFLDEIGKMTNLEYLDLEVITAEDLTPLASLSNLKTLKLDSVRKASDFAPLLELNGVTRLFISNATHLDSTDLFSEAHHLESLGIEGGMWTTQMLDSLDPLAGLEKLEALFFTNTRLRNKSLTALSRISNLKVLECARFAPEKEFNLLRKLMPDLECAWCDDYDV